MKVPPAPGVQVPPFKHGFGLHGPPGAIIIDFFLKKRWNSMYLF